MDKKLKELLAKHGIKKEEWKKAWTANRDKGKSNNVKAYSSNNRNNTGPHNSHFVQHLTTNNKESHWLDGSWEFNPTTGETKYFSPEETRRRDKERKWTPVSNVQEYLETPGPKIIVKKKK